MGSRPHDGKANGLLLGKQLPGIHGQFRMGRRPRIWKEDLRAWKVRQVLRVRTLQKRVLLRKRQVVRCREETEQDHGAGAPGRGGGSDTAEILMDRCIQDPVEEVSEGVGDGSMRTFPRETPSGHPSISLTSRNHPERKRRTISKGSSRTWRQSSWTLRKGSQNSIRKRMNERSEGSFPYIHIG